jgi:hypothetical protein
MKKQSLFASIAIFLFILASSVTAAGIYTWTDQEGEVHYGDRVPPEYKNAATKLKSHSPRAYGQKTSTPAKILQEKLGRLNETNKQQAERDLEQKQAQTAKDTREKNCRLAKNNLKTMQERARIRVKEKSGEYRMLSHEEKTKKESALKKQIKEFCTE